MIAKDLSSSCYGILRDHDRAGPLAFLARVPLLGMVDVSLASDVIRWDERFDQS
jgi:hypothetical protein